MKRTVLYRAGGSGRGDCSDCHVVVPHGARSGGLSPQPESMRGAAGMDLPRGPGGCEMAGGASTGRPLTPTLSHGEREKERPAEESLADLRSCLLGRGSKRGTDSGSELGAVGRDRLGDR